MWHKIDVVECGEGEAGHFEKDHELLGGIAIIFAKKHGSARVDAIIDGTFIKGERKNTVRSPLLKTNHKKSDLQHFIQWLLYTMPWIITDEQEEDIDYVCIEDDLSGDAHV